MMNKIESLENFVAMVPVLKASVPADLSIAVCDLKKFIAYFPGETINLNIKVGQQLMSDEPLAVALQKNQSLKSNVPAEFYGFEFTGTAIPLHNQKGEVIGGIAVQLRRQSELIAIADQILVSLSQASDQITSVANGSSLLADFSRNLLTHSKQANEDVKNSTGVLSIIKKVADETNLLGLNAAIEAAHAGDNGKGFGVVANEIRKFSKETVDSTKKINDTMNQIQNVTDQMAQLIEKIAAIGQEQAAAIQQTSTFIEEIQKMSNQLTQFANKL